jgi:hypothetical protein
MRLSIVPAFAVLGAVALAGCGGSNSVTSPTTTTTTTTTTTAATLTETYKGNLNVNGAASYAFAVGTGTITATLTSVGDTAVTVGLALGTWSGTTCTLAITNDAAVAGSTVIGSTSSAANVCVRIYDVGFLTTTIPYTITVTHP